MGGVLVYALAFWRSSGIELSLVGCQNAEISDLIKKSRHLFFDECVGICNNHTHAAAREKITKRISRHLICRYRKKSAGNYFE